MVYIAIQDLPKTCFQSAARRDSQEGREDICERCTNAGELMVQAQRDRIEIMVTSDWLALIMAVPS